MERIERMLKADLEIPDLTAAGRRLLDEAERRGLVDVSYAGVDSPMGPLLVAVTPRGLVRLAYNSNERSDAVLQELADRVSPRIFESPARLDEVRRELDEYFERKRIEFELPVDWSLSRGFTRKVLRATARIPYGNVVTYKDVARRAGNERASRAAGNALGANPIPIVVPCHRVVHSGGGLGGYTGGLERKKVLLGIEGALNPG
jgi:methylated-DNA-[protein]-cysteine S-methyltransferase